jgi:hypothetical protein
VVLLGLLLGLGVGGGAEASVELSEAVAELGVPLALASAAGSWAGVAAGSVPYDGDVVDEDGALCVVWAVGSAGAVCWARADPAKPARVSAATAAVRRSLVMEASRYCRVGK